MLFRSHVLQKSQSWGNADNLMYVAGATRGEMLKRARDIAPDNFFLVPGVGAQGGNLEDVAEYCLNDQCGLLVNSSRGIIYADNGRDYAIRAREEAIILQQQMTCILTVNGII